MNYYEIENESLRKEFNLEEVIAFQMQNDIQVIQGEDLQYTSYINKEGYFGSALTPLFAMWVGIKEYKRFKSK